LKTYEDIVSITSYGFPNPTHIFFAHRTFITIVQGQDHHLDRV
jgi:hypothetical protein